MKQVSPNPFLFCQLILRAFIESLARTSGLSSLRSLTYHRSLLSGGPIDLKPYRQRQTLWVQ